MKGGGEGGVKDTTRTSVYPKASLIFKKRRPAAEKYNGVLRATLKIIGRRLPFFVFLLFRRATVFVTVCQYQCSIFFYDCCMDFSN